VDRLTASWRNWPWQIRQEKPRSPAETLALDEVLLDAVGQGTHGPTLAFWQWTKPVLVLGRSQSVQNEVDVPSAQEHGFELARRISGGGAMLIEPEGAITYSLILPETAVAGLTIRQSYEVCDAWVVRGLRDLGLDAHYVPTNDMACSRGKIAGAAQARRRGAVLHHTTVAYSLDSDVMAKVLRIGRGKISARGVTSAAKCVAPLVLQTSHSREVIVARLVQSFQVRYGGEFTEETAEERRLAEQLAREKYSTAAWVHDIP
jgi:lipoate-protein ligase A